MFAGITNLLRVTLINKIIQQISLSTNKSAALFAEMFINFMSGVVHCIFFYSICAMS